MQAVVSGYVKLFRCIHDNHLWFTEPFTRAQAWIDMILLANYKDSSIRVRGNLLPVKRGQLGWSQDSLAKRWKWSRGKVARFLDELETEQQIEQQKNNLTSLITITNYELYQGDDTTDDTTDGATDGQQTDTNKKVKNIKKESVARFAPPSLEEVVAYCQERNNGVDAVKWHNHYQANGWMVGKTKMKDWRAAVRKWETSEQTAKPVLTEEQRFEAMYGKAIW